MNGRQVFFLTVAFAVGVLVGYQVRGMRAPRTTPAPARMEQTGVVRISFQEAPQHIGKEAVVYGKIVRVGHSQRSNTYFLNFCYDWRNCPFTAVIFASALPRFQEAGIHPRDYEGKEVEIRGYIKEYRGRAEIIVESPDQVRVLGGDQ